MGKVWCSSDWHGCGKVARKVLDYLQPDDTLIFIGDAIDRGPDGWKIMKELLNDKRVIYLQGNHEKMMADYINNYIEGYNHNFLWFGNGGEDTWQDIENLSDNILREIAIAIYRMPTEYIYKSPKGHTVILEHAGYTPFDIPHRSHDPLWDREHFYDNWDGGFEIKDFDPETTYLVHGHTPTVYLRYLYGYNGMSDKMTKKDFIIKRQFLEDKILTGEEIIKPEIIRYCDGHKFCIDCCTIVSNRVALLDLDTFEVIYFDAD